MATTLVPSIPLVNPTPQAIHHEAQRVYSRRARIVVYCTCGMSTTGKGIRTWRFCPRCGAAIERARR